MMNKSESTTCETCHEYLDGWKRAKADYANLQKEVEKEREALRAYANEHLLQNILPAVDQYDVALKHTPDIKNCPEAEQKQLKNWLIGLHAVRDILARAFESVGLTSVREDGEFDPEIHEAVKEEPSASPDGTIISVEQSGWTFNGKVLRPAKVTVSKKS